MTGEKVSGRLAFLGSVPKRGTKDIVAEAAEAFAAYRGLGRDIIDDLIAETLALRKEWQDKQRMLIAALEELEKRTPPAMTQQMIEAGIMAYGSDDDRPTAARVLDIWVAMNLAAEAHADELIEKIRDDA